MRYELYIDVFFCVNFVMDTILLFILRRIRKAAASRRRILAAGAAGALSACVVCVGMVWMVNAGSGVSAVTEYAGSTGEFAETENVGAAEAAEKAAEFAETENAGEAEKAVELTETENAGTAEAADAAGWIVVAAEWFMALAGIVFPAVVMVRIAFRPPDLREYGKDCLLLLFTAVCAGGIMEAVYQHTKAGYWLALLRNAAVSEGLPVPVWIFLVCGFLFWFRYLWLTAFEARRETADRYRVVLRTGEWKTEARALLDTGNRLREPESGRDVHIVSERIWTLLDHPGAKICRIPYRTVGSPWALMEIMEIDAIEVFHEAENGRKPFTEVLSRPLIGRASFPLSGREDYEILLHGGSRL